MKCGIKVNNRQCRNNATSGLTIGILDSVVYCCVRHYKKYANVDAINVPVYVSTKKVIIDQIPEEGTMNITQKYYELELEGGIHKLPLPRHITMEELALLPDIDADKLTNGINRAYDKCYKKGQTHMVEKLATSSRDNSKPGYIFTGSDYQGYIGHNGENFVMVFDRGTKQCVKVDPIDIYKKEEVMKTNKQIGCGYCHNYHDTADEVAACGGKVRVAGAELTKNIPFFRAWKNGDGAWMGGFWFPTKNEAEECRKHYDVKTFKLARNGHGYWVYVHPATAAKKGDFKDMIHVYKTHKAFNNNS